MTHIKVNTNPWQYPNVCFTCHHMRRIKFEFRPTQNDFIGWLSESVCDKQGCQPSTSSNIENWWGLGDRWRHNAGHMTSFFGKNARKRCCFNCNIWPNWFTFHQSHYCLGILQWQTGVCVETFIINRKIAQTVQNIWYFIVRESNLQERANFGDYPGDWEKQFKIWSLPDYPGELTALDKHGQQTCKLKVKQVSIVVKCILAFLAF